MNSYCKIPDCKINSQCNMLQNSILAISSVLGRSLKSLNLTIIHHEFYFFIQFKVSY